MLIKKPIMQPQPIQPDVLAFLSEMYKRFALKSPKFFQVFQLIAVFAGVVSGIPYLVKQANDMFHFAFVLPDWVLVLSNKAVAVGALTTWIMAKLPVTNSTTQAVKEPEKLPFTAKKIESDVEPPKQ